MDGNTPVVIPVPNLEELGIGASDDLALLGDPFVFAVEINTDADADQRPGIQVVISVDLSSQEGLDDLTPDQLVYAKYYTQAAIDAAIAKYGELLGLDGKPVTEEGWYPFMRQLVSGEYSDGAEFVVVNGNLTLNIYLTDNAFGDIDLDLY